MLSIFVTVNFDGSWKKDPETISSFNFRPQYYNRYFFSSPKSYRSGVNLDFPLFYCNQTKYT